MSETDQSLFAQWRIHLVETMKRFDSSMDEVKAQLEELKTKQALAEQKMEGIESLTKKIEILDDLIKELKSQMKTIAYIGGGVVTIITGVLIIYLGNMITGAPA